MPRLLLALACCASTATALQWAGTRRSSPRASRPLGSAAAALAPPALQLQPGSAPLAGHLFYGTCDLPSCDTLEFASLDLATQAKTDLFDFPLDSFEDAYVADDVLIGNEVTISLNWDKDPAWGYLAVFDLTTNKLVSGRNSSSCFALWENPAEPATSLLCLNLVAAQPACPPGTTSQCTKLLAIDRATGKETLIASMMPNYAPFTVETLDVKNGLIYATFELLDGGLPQLVTINARTGAVQHTASFQPTLAFIELEWSAKTGKVYAVVQDTDAAGKPVAYAGTVAPSTATPTPLGPKAYFNVSYPPATGGFFNRAFLLSSSLPWLLATHSTHTHTHTHTHAHSLTRAEFNTISTLSDELNVFFSTAFHYAVPSPPADPILHLIGNDLTTGELVYDAVVANPFCEILWLPGAR